MDYSLAALKMFASQLGSSPAQMLFGIRFQRAWIQGMVVRVDYCVGDRRLFVDDGPCVTELMLRPADAKGQPWRPGSPNLSDFCLALFDFYTMSLDEKGRDRLLHGHDCFLSISIFLAPPPTSSTPSGK
ncbi:hypothetical protein ZWY2020_020775, partial [Hordeum vulgare]